MLRKPCTVNPRPRGRPVGMQAPERDGEIADALGREETATVVGEQVFAGAGGNDGQGDVVKRHDQRFGTEFLVLQILDRHGPGSRFEIDVPALAKRAGLQREAVARMKSKRREIGSDRWLSSTTSSGARRQSRAGIGLCERTERGDQPKARSLARSTGERRSTLPARAARRRMRTRPWPRYRRATPSRAAGGGGSRPYAPA